MNRQIIPIICALIATLSSHVNAVEIGGLYFTTDNGKAVLIPKYENANSTMPCQDIIGDVVIPEKVIIDYMRFDVTSIAYGAFKNCSEITSVSIPTSITSIGGDAFLGCSSLKFISIPGSVTMISMNAFNQCPGLESVYIEEGVTTLDWYSFYSCKNLTTVSIPSTVTSIDKESFKDCSKLKNVIINKTNLSTKSLSVGSNAFAGLPDNPNLYVPVESGKSGSITFGGINFNAIPSVSVTYNTAYTRTEALENNSGVIYYRDFAGIENWQALYVPFTSDYSEWKEYFIIADLVKSTESEGQDVLSWYELGGENDEHNQVLAGHPYIIKRRPNTDLPADMQSFMIFNNKSVTKSDVHDPVTINGVYGNYTLGGTYSGGTASQLANNVIGDFYALGMGGNFVQAENPSTQTLSANRIYLISQKKNSAQANQAPFRMSFLEEDPGEPSSIDDCVAIEQPGDDAVYDLYGRRVANPKSGIYIKNGRKFIIK